MISPNGLVSDEISARIRKARLVFANLRHLWRRPDIRLSIKGRIYCAAVRSVLIYGSETWPLRVEHTPNCYSKVREETNFLRSLINGQLPSDHEVKFIYNDDNSTNASVSNAEVKVPSSRPSWFPSIPQETKSPGGENS
ncbi:unnamed protein product [Schistosoma mattheei]|uniref:Uncharacterized protein n=1 Tax=Schistosoma mattheei TaxID=31246 RepID=A0A3P8FZN6_9TREM|nr:unnamed protein product [Schistosoma mattheei]